jgi:hypothetical protein
MKAGQRRAVNFEDLQPLAQAHALPSGSGLRWLYVDFNRYFAILEQLNPALRGKPFLVGLLLCLSVNRR